MQARAPELHRPSTATVGDALTFPSGATAAPRHHRTTAADFRMTSPAPALAAPVRPRPAWPWRRVTALLAVSVALHLLALGRAREELDFELPPPVQTVRAELFRMPAQIAVQAQKAPAPPRRAPRAITPPVPAAPVAPPEASPPAPPEAAPTPDAQPTDDVLPAAPANALPQEQSAASPIDAVVVSFPKVGRFTSDTIYRKGLLQVTGSTQIEWRIGAERYEAKSVTVDDNGRPVLTLASQGRVMPAVGVAPERYTEQRMERAPQAVNFQWDGRKVTFSASSAEFPLNDGVQDQLSFMAQLALLAQAFPDRFQPGMAVAMEVAGTRNVRVYDLRVVGWESIGTPAGPTETLKIERVLPAGARDARIALWLAPSLRWLPARTRTVLPNEDTVETVLRDVWFIE